MKGIIKIELSTSPEEFEIPQKAKVVKVTTNGSMPVLWIEGKDTKVNREYVQFVVLKTGDVIRNEAKYCGSCGTNDNMLHVYQL